MEVKKLDAYLLFWHFANRVRPFAFNPDVVAELVRRGFLFSPSTSLYPRRELFDEFYPTSKGFEEFAPVSTNMTRVQFEELYGPLTLEEPAYDSARAVLLQNFLCCGFRAIGQRWAFFRVIRGCLEGALVCSLLTDARSPLVYDFSDKELL